ncbi:MAG: SRPBCC family protein [Acidimicrobiales bacterium]
MFVERFGDFKPKEHNMLGAEIVETRFEPEVGGHIYDRAADGSECRGARVLAYEPPDRVVFSWDISPSWQLETDPDNASQVEVRFTAETPTRTRVDLEHRNLERHGPGWEGVRDSMADNGSFPPIRPAQACALSAPPITLVVASCAPRESRVLHLRAR